MTFVGQSIHISHAAPPPPPPLLGWSAWWLRGLAGIWPPKRSGPFPGAATWRAQPWPCVPPGWPPRCLYEIPAWLWSPSGGMHIRCTTAPTTHSYCSVPVALATACLSAAGHWSRRGSHWRSSSAGWWDWKCFPEHHAFHLRPFASLPGALTRSPWHCIHSWAASSGRLCRGRFLHSWPLGRRSSPSPFVWITSGTTGSQAPLKHPGHEKHRFSRSRWASHWL